MINIFTGEVESKKTLELVVLTPPMLSVHVTDD